MKRRDVETIIRRLMEPLVTSRALELVDVEFVKEGGDYHLRVYLDKAGGIGIEECQEVSKELGRLLDNEDVVQEHYYMEVSSPGLDRPLKKDEDFVTFKGRRVEIRTYAPLDGRKDLSGTLLGLEDGEVLLRTQEGDIRIPREKVARARLALDF